MSMAAYPDMTERYYPATQNVLLVPPSPTPPVVPVPQGTVYYNDYGAYPAGTNCYPAPGNANCTYYYPVTNISATALDNADPPPFMVPVAPLMTQAAETAVVQALLRANIDAENNGKAQANVDAENNVQSQGQVLPGERVVEPALFTVFPGDFWLPGDLARPLGDFRADCLE